MNRTIIGLLFILAGISYGSMAIDDIYSHTLGWLAKNGYDAETQLIALLHDAPEALSGIGDQQRPMKTDYCRHVEGRIWREAIALKYLLPAEIPEIVHEIDGRIIADEMQQNCHECDPRHDTPLGVTLKFWSPGVAEIHFMDAFRRLAR